jgi:hypothetical protein
MPDNEDAAISKADLLDLNADVERLRREVYSVPPGPSNAALLDELSEAEARLAQAKAPASRPDGVILSTASATPKNLLSKDTTGLEVEVKLKMAQLPGAIVHLLDPEKYPLVEISARNVKADNKTRRVRVTTFVEGYSAHVVDTLELPSPDPKPPHIFRQLPTFYPDRLATVVELTRAVVNVCVEDLDGAIELQNTKPFWIAPRTTALLAVRDPATGASTDFTPYLGVYVTPNAPEIMTFLREGARLHPDHRLVGYQGEPILGAGAQVRALYNALKSTADITYINSVIAISTQNGVACQRVRLPRESLADKSANCIDGTVLFASLLEAASLNPAIVLVPGHAFLAWETWRKSGKFNYLETTMIGTHSFEEACTAGETLAAKLTLSGKMTVHSLRQLRLDGIYPMA